MSGRITNPVGHPLWLLMTTMLCASCASTAPSAQLTDARSAYERASHGITEELNPSGLHDAEQALAKAENAHQEDARSEEAEDLAYIAHRKVQIAVAEAEAIEAKNQEERSEAGYTEELRTTAITASAELEASQGALATETSARLAAEKRAKEALQALEDVANVREDARGMTITLSGAVIFKTGSSELRDLAKTQLSNVADALEGYPDDPIVVEGHTDSQGSEGYNRKLSQKRADSVRSYLIGQGVAPDRITAVGKGENEPLASNDSAEGRANNRRVEIIVGSPGD
jgi:outer membrane protein OmpA-like peptidoglycan-associated protein